MRVKENVMGDDINGLILKLQHALNKKYGKHFKKFYLTKHIEKSDNWEGLIHSSEKGERNVEYFSISQEEVIKDEKIFH